MDSSDSNLRFDPFPLITAPIPTITPVFIESDTSQYRFDRAIQGLTISFPIDFVKENGSWKIMEY